MSEKRVHARRAAAHLNLLLAEGDLSEYDRNALAAALSVANRIASGDSWGR